MKEREFEVVLVLVDDTVLARHIRTFSSQEEARFRAKELNRDLSEWAVVRWIMRPNAKWSGLYRE